MAFRNIEICIYLHLKNAHCRTISFQNVGKMPRIMPFKNNNCKICIHCDKTQKKSKIFAKIFILIIIINYNILSLYFPLIQLFLTVLWDIISTP